MKIKVAFNDLEKKLLASFDAKPEDLSKCIDQAVTSAVLGFFKEVLSEKKKA